MTAGRTGLPVVTVLAPLAPPNSRAGSRRRSPRPGTQRLVGAAHHRVLLVDHGWHAASRGGVERRHGRIAAEADDDRGLDPARSAARPGARRARCVQKARASAMGFFEPIVADGIGWIGGRKLAGETLGAVVGDEMHLNSRAPSASCASASAGNRWPPVPPAASMTALGHVTPPVLRAAALRKNRRA
jgi:hypothetical protein